MLTDNYPSETAWTVVDKCNSDTVVLQGGSYTSSGKLYVDSTSAEPSQYSFIITDSFGDGICCGPTGHV